MSKVLILQGPPCSGKSTFALKYIKGKESKVVLISKDAIRISMCGGNLNTFISVNTPERERIAFNTELAMLQGCLIEQFDVVLDDTNLNPHHLQIIRDVITAHKGEYEFKHFYIPYEEAIKRNKNRQLNGGHFVPETIIQQYYNTYYSNLNES